MEFLQKQDCVSEIYAFDPDKKMVDIANLIRNELNLDKVKRIDHLNNQQTWHLPYENNFFDVILVIAVVEHLPTEGRYLSVDEYYRKLNKNGHIGFFDTPNKRFFFEGHSVGLPYVHRMKPENAYIYGKMFGKFKKIDFTDFVRPGTGWQNSSYSELLPKTVTIDLVDVSKEMGYVGTDAATPGKKWSKKSWKYWLLKFLAFKAKVQKVPEGFVFPYMNVIFKKTHSYDE